MGKLTLSDKINVINDCHSDKQVNVARRYGISRASVTKILQNADKYIANIENGSTLRLVESKYQDLEEKLFEFIVDCDQKCIPLSIHLIKEKAILIKENLHVQDFAASVGWIYKFLKRYRVSSRKIVGEAKSVDQNVVNIWVQKLPELISNYPDYLVFNADETALFVHCLPSTSYLPPGSSTSGLKMSKKRLTVMLCASNSGKKLLPAIIGTAKKPRNYHPNPNIRYFSNKTAWMTGDIFTEWLKELDENLCKKGEKILLFVDNCPSHIVKSELKNVKVEFLPKNTTSMLQPLDAGIIHSFKSHYRKQIVKIILNDSKRPTDLTFTETIEKIVISWENVSEETIINSFRHCHM